MRLRVEVEFDAVLQNTRLLVGAHDIKEVSRFHFGTSLSANPITTRLTNWEHRPGQGRPVITCPSAAHPLGGLSQAQLSALAQWRSSGLFSKKERDVLAYAEEMTLQVQVPEEVFGNARRHFSDREMVELTATVAAYNMVSRFLEALKIDTEGE
jgi:hypothetical protein